MKTLFEATTVEEVKARMEKLRPDTERLWGRMSPAQALAHCSTMMELAVGLNFPPRTLTGRIFGRYAKSIIWKEKPLPRNMPTDKHFVVSDERELAVERKRLSGLIDRLATGPEACTKHPHTFFGPLSPMEWAVLTYRHLDHHLRQFQV
jgi:hypothetical protein